jgi:hypothetical protein
MSLVQTPSRWYYITPLKWLGITRTAHASTNHILLKNSPIQIRLVAKVRAMTSATSNWIIYVKEAESINMMQRLWRSFSFLWFQALNTFLYVPPVKNIYLYSVFCTHLETSMPVPYIRLPQELLHLALLSRFELVTANSRGLIVYLHFCKYWKTCNSLNCKRWGAWLNEGEKLRRSQKS